MYSKNPNNGRLSRLNPSTLRLTQQKGANVNLLFNGNFAYSFSTSNDPGNISNKVYMYSFDPKTGVLQAPQIVLQPGMTITSIAFSSSGQYFYIGNSQGELYAYKVNSQDGTFVPVSQGSVYSGIPNLGAITSGANGNLYVTSLPNSSMPAMVFCLNVNSDGTLNEIDVSEYWRALTMGNLILHPSGNIYYFSAKVHSMRLIGREFFYDIYAVQLDSDGGATKHGALVYRTEFENTPPKLVLDPEGKFIYAVDLEVYLRGDELHGGGFGIGLTDPYLPIITPTYPEPIFFPIVDFTF